MFALNSGLLFSLGRFPEPFPYSGPLGWYCVCVGTLFAWNTVPFGWLGTPFRGNVEPSAAYNIIQIYMLHVKINRTCNIFSSQTLNEHTCITCRTLIIHTPSHRPMQPYFVGFYLYIGDTSTFVWMQLLTSSISVECKPPACREHGLHGIWRDVDILLWPWCDLDLDVWPWPY